MKKRKYPLEIIDHARELYLETYKDNKGKTRKRYTWTEIKEIIDKKYGTNIHIQSLKYYAQKERWNLQLEHLYNVSVPRKAETFTGEKYEMELRKEVSEQAQTNPLPEDEKDRILEIFSKAKKQAVLNQIRVSNRMNEAMKNISTKDKMFARYCEVASKVNKTLMEMLEMIDVKPTSIEKPVIIINEVNIENNKE